MTVKKDISNYPKIYTPILATIGIISGFYTYQGWVNDVFDQWWAMGVLTIGSLFYTIMGLIEIRKKIPPNGKETILDDNADSLE